MACCCFWRRIALHTRHFPVLATQHNNSSLSRFTLSLSRFTLSLSLSLSLPSHTHTLSLTSFVTLSLSLAHVQHSHTIHALRRCRIPLGLARTTVLRSQRSTKTMSGSDPQQPREVQISVPWGHVQALHWPGTGPNVLAVHGWLDNANSFVPLLRPRGSPPILHGAQAGSEAGDASKAAQPSSEQLSQEQEGLLNQLNIVAIDLPGHGRSSHKPRGSSYLLVDWVRDVHFVLKALGWEHVHMVGHSLGAGISNVFTSCFPEKVLSLTLLEGNFVCVCLCVCVCVCVWVGACLCLCLRLSLYACLCLCLRLSLCVCVN